MSEGQHNKKVRQWSKQKIFFRIILYVCAPVVLAGIALLLVCCIPRQAEFVYNDGLMGHYLYEMPVEYVEEKWEHNDVRDLLPPPVADGMVVSQVYPKFDQKGELCGLKVVYTKEKPEMEITVTWMLHEYSVVYFDKAVLTTRGGLTYRIGEQHANTLGIESLCLIAETTIGKITGVFYMEEIPELEEEMKHEFEFLLDLYGEYPPQEDAFNKLRPKGEI